MKALLRHFRPQLIPVALALVSCLAVGPGCSSYSYSSEQLKVLSDPAGANVHLSNGVTGITPVVFGVPRHGALTVTVSKEGYETAQVVVKADHLNGWGVANVTASIVGGAVSPAGLVLMPVFIVASLHADGNHNHQPNPIKVTLTPLKPHSPPAESNAPAASTQ